MNQTDGGVLNASAWRYRHNVTDRGLVLVRLPSMKKAAT
jgi:hypothetical protein